ncbi:polyribonucleotide nucleotidyltransferase [Sneathiella glossodoripedis]|uniref:polyribonucleotide nucleotidyltransferase n=1 Tax=Sneathiella glossodoripedis TaxID=418853 RepID=UPI00046EA33D|nr:polyribonucleotide nucleotidyltransferase [Sneathiella glossodoripedis]
MFEVHRKEVMWGGRPLVMETGKVARQADGAVMITYGGTQVLCTAVAAKAEKPGVDFFPLTVNYQEKAYAAGKIPGGFFKREGRPSEKETLVSRLIDRPLRPSFVSGFKNETQIICTVLAHDLENDPDVISLIGASAALTISGIPFMGPVGAARVGMIDGEYILNPTAEQMADTDLDLVIAGTSEAVLMIESEASELSEEQMLGAVMYGHREFQPVIDAIIDLAEECAKEPWDYQPAEVDAELEAKVKAAAEDALTEAYKVQVKQDRVEQVNAAKQAVLETLEEDQIEAANAILKKIEKKIVRGNIISTGKRIDGRDTKTVRPIVAEVGALPRAHGSALFTRGETQALVVTTLGTGQDEQIVDALEGEYRENFMLHYNFPPYSVGEAGRVGFTGRREVGHGKLAWRAIHPVLPGKESFPYTLRVVSEVTESNGSSSMATVCGTSLALMDAGVPLEAPVAGIAMGLILEEDGQFAVLSDILGDEDHLGDMDFKVAGTGEGITSLQMDIKIAGITEEIMRQALAQATEGRLHILEEMAKALDAARDGVRDGAPRITQLNVAKDKIRDIIGTGGKVIREICETTGAKIDIEDDGTVKVAATSTESADAAVNWIKSIVDDPEVGVTYTGKVVKVVDFGAFVNFFGNRDGLVHISELAPKRVAKVTDVVNEGDEVRVKVLEIDGRGKVRLSIKAVLADEAEDDATTEDNSED